MNLKCQSKCMDDGVILCYDDDDDDDEQKWWYDVVGNS